MPEVNLVGDVVLTDPRAMRVLADASRLALQYLFPPHGPATANDLAPLFELVTASGQTVNHCTASIVVGETRR